MFCACYRKNIRNLLDDLVCLTQRRQEKALKVNILSGGKNIINEMSMSDLKIPSNTLAELRGVLVRALSRENLSMSDKRAIRKSESSSSLKIHCTWSSSYGGKPTG